MHVLQVVIFRGTGGIHNSDHPYYHEHPLIRAGHVGVIGIVDNRIIGFHPTPTAAKEKGGEEQLLDELINGKPQPGCLQDDTHFFQRAYELADETNGRTAVYLYEVVVSTSITEQMFSWYTESKIVPYNLPDNNGNFIVGESNCATFWLDYFRIPLPISTGRIKFLTEKMKEEGYTLWHPSD